MFDDIIESKLRKFNKNCRDKNNNLPKKGKRMDQFIDNIVDLSLELNNKKVLNNYLLFSNKINCYEEVKYIPKNKAFKFKGNTVSTYITEDDISELKHNKNIFIFAGTGKGKNYFINNQLLTNIGNKKVIILLNRQVLLNQQIKDLLDEDISDDYCENIIKVFNSENSMILGKKGNIMIVSYQKAALNILYKNKEFLKFLSKTRYIVFDEIHYLLDDSYFNKSVNIIVKNLVKKESPFKKQKLHPKVNKIFMSATMEEMLILMQMWGYELKKDNYFYVNNDVLSDWDIQTSHNSNNYILEMPTDYKYIVPHMYSKYADIIPFIENSKDDKWLIFVNSKEEGKELCNEINNKCGKKSAVFINADNKKNESIRDVYETLTNNEKFDSKVLIATSVIYNGVNIKEDRKSVV